MNNNNNMKQQYQVPQAVVEDLWLSQLLCDSLVGDLEPTFDEPI